MGFAEVEGGISAAAADIPLQQLYLYSCMSGKHLKIQTFPKIPPMVDYGAWEELFLSFFL